MLYNGKSEEITIVEGDENFLELLLKKQADFLVAFDTDGGTEVDNQLLFSGESALEPESAPTKSGYTFLGWFASESDKDFFDFSTPIVDDTLLLAKWVKNENVFTPTSNTEFYDYSLLDSDTYLLRLNNFECTADIYASALQGRVTQSDIHATLYVDIIGTNKSIAGNHGGFKFSISDSSIRNSSVDVIFFSSSSGSFEFGHQTDNAGDLQIDYETEGYLSATFSAMNSCTMSDMSVADVACSTADEFFEKAKAQTVDGKTSKFTIRKN